MLCLLNWLVLVFFVVLGYLEDPKLMPHVAWIKCFLSRVDILSFFCSTSSAEHVYLGNSMLTSSATPTTFNAHADATAGQPV